MFAKRCSRLAAGPDQGAVIHRFDLLAGQIISAIGNALGFQPGKMIEGLRGIKIAFGFVGTGTASHFEIGCKIFGLILKAGIALRLGTAIPADIDLAAGKAGRATAARTALEQHDFRAGLFGFNRCACSRRTKTDDHNIGFKIPFFDLRRGIGSV